jgi:hypothetical protein
MDSRFETAIDHLAALAAAGPHTLRRDDDGRPVAPETMASYSASIVADWLAEDDANVTTFVAMTVAMFTAIREIVQVYVEGGDPDVLFADAVTLLRSEFEPGDA